MKIAVCLSGQSRTFDYCKESIKLFFKDCDFFCHTYDYNSYHEHGTSPIHDKWDSKIINSINETLNPKLLKVESREETIKLFKDYGYRDTEKELNCWSMYHSIIESYDYDFSDYDFVVKSRYDLIHHIGRTIQNEITDVISPPIHHRFMVNDRINPGDAGYFPMNDAQWITDSDTAKLIYNFKRAIAERYPTNKVFLRYLIDNDPTLDCIETGQSWEIVRPRHIRIEKDWKKLISQYYSLLENSTKFSDPLIDEERSENFWREGNKV